MLVSVAVAQDGVPSEAVEAPPAPKANEADVAPAAPLAQPEDPVPQATSSETVADPGAIPEGGFIGNDAYGAIPLGSGWGYVWAVYIVTWLTMLGYAGYLALRNRSTS